MDTGKGYFEQYKTLKEALAAREKNMAFAGGIFTKGEIVEIKGSRFKITQILHNGLKLKLLAKDEGV